MVYVCFMYTRSLAVGFMIEDLQSIDLTAVGLTGHMTTTVQ